MDGLKTSRKIKLLLLVEVAAQEDVQATTNEDFSGPVLQGRGGITAWRPDHIAGDIEQALIRHFGKGRFTDELWYVKSVKQAIGQ